MGQSLGCLCRAALQLQGLSAQCCRARAHTCHSWLAQAPENFRSRERWLLRGGNDVVVLKLVGLVELLNRHPLVLRAGHSLLCHGDESGQRKRSAVCAGLFLAASRRGAGRRPHGKAAQWSMLSGLRQAVFCPSFAMSSPGKVLAGWLAGSHLTPTLRQRSNKVKTEHHRQRGFMQLISLRSPSTLLLEPELPAPQTRNSCRRGCRRPHSSMAASEDPQPHVAEEDVAGHARQALSEAEILAVFREFDTDHSNT